jgi:hypothetical protein
MKRINYHRFKTKREAIEFNNKWPRAVQIVKYKSSWIRLVVSFTENKYYALGDHAWHYEIPFYEEVIAPHLKRQ